MKMFDRNKVFKCLLAINIMLVLLYLITSFPFSSPHTPSHLFNLDAEANIPTWFSSAQLFLLFILSIHYSIQIDNRNLRNFYSLLGLVFLFFSADETSGIHESITRISKNLSIFPDSHGMWILVYPIILLMLGCVYWKGLLDFLHEKIGRTIFIIGGVIFVIGGVGFEIFGYFLSSDQNSEHVLSLIQITVEESFELLGQSLMIYALLSKLDSINNID
jgi:hypothetical protein